MRSLSISKPQLCTFIIEYLSFSHLYKHNWCAVEEGDEEEDKECDSHVPVLLPQVLDESIMFVLIKEHSLLQNLYRKD